MTSVCPCPNEETCHHFFFMIQQSCFKFLCSKHDCFTQWQLFICRSVSLVVIRFLLCTWNFVWDWECHNEVWRFGLIKKPSTWYLHVNCFFKNIWGKVFKSGLSKFCGRQEKTFKFLKGSTFHKIYFVHSWILWLICFRFYFLAGIHRTIWNRSWTGHFYFTLCSFCWSFKTYRMNRYVRIIAF